MRTPQHSPSDRSQHIRLQISNTWSQTKISFSHNGKQKNLETIFSLTPQEIQEINTYTKNGYLCIGVRTIGAEYPQYMKDFFEEYNEYIVNGRETTLERMNNREEMFVLVPIKNQSVHSQSQEFQNDIMKIIGMDQKTMEKNAMDVDSIIPPGAHEILDDMNPNSLKNTLSNLNIQDTK